MARLWKGFFDSTPEDDRLLYAEDWARFFRALFSDGVFNMGKCLQVDAVPGNLAVAIQTGDRVETVTVDNGQPTERAEDIRVGRALVQGYEFRLEEDSYGNTCELTLPDAHPNYPRVDRIVLRLDRRIDARSVLPEVKMGVASNAPVPPELTRDHNMWELSLARVRVNAGAKAITPDMVTDERWDAALCGLVMPIVNIDTSSFQNQINNIIALRVAEFNAVLADKSAEADRRLAAFGQMKTLVETWYAAVQNNIAALQSFVFDNLPALAEARLDAVFGASAITETIVGLLDGTKIADRVTTFQTNGMTVVTKVYSGGSVAKQATETTTFTANGMSTTCKGWNDYAVIGGGGGDGGNGAEIAEAIAGLERRKVEKADTFSNLEIENMFGE